MQKVNFVTSSITGSSPMPDSITYLGGFAGELVDHYAANAPTKSRWHAFAGVLAGLSAACNNNYVYVGKNGLLSSTSLYLLLIQRTGDGKEHAVRASNEITSAAQTTFASRITSDAALHEALLHAPNATLLYQRDEFGRFMQNMRRNAQSSENTLWTMLMEVFGRSQGELPKRHYAQKKDIKQAVKRPYVTFLGTTTLKSLEGAFGGTAVEDGTLNRLIPLSGPRAGYVEDTEVHAPQKLDTRQKSILNYIARGPKVTVDDKKKPNALAMVRPDDLAKKLMGQWDREYFDRIQGENGTHWARAFEHLIRLATVLAVADAADAAHSRNLENIPNEVVMNSGHCKAARLVVEEGIKWSARELGGTEATMEDMLEQRILQYLREAVTDAETLKKIQKEGLWHRRNALNKRLRRSKFEGHTPTQRQIDEAYTRLRDDGQVELTSRNFEGKRQSAEAVRLYYKRPN